MENVVAVAPGMFTVFLRHWNETAPAAATVKLAAPPAHVVTPTGCVVIVGLPVLTANIAAALVDQPHAFVATQSKRPASPATTETIVNHDAVTPPMGTVFLRHWNDAASLAAIVNVADVPTHFD